MRTVSARSEKTRHSAGFLKPPRSNWPTFSLVLSSIALSLSKITGDFFELRRRTELLPIIQLVRECRDPEEGKILEVALDGRTDVIITCDEDLLALHPWRGIAIVAPAEYPLL